MDNAFLGYACDILADTTNGLTGTEIIKYCNRFAIDYNVVIPVDNVEMLKTTYKNPIPNKRTALKMNLDAFNINQQIEIINFLCNLPKFHAKEEINELMEKMNKRFNNQQNEMTEKITETKHWLINYPKSLKLYNEALNKYEQGIFERNVLDDMRLSLELLLKELLHNNQSLENQLKFVGKELKIKNISKEITNLFDKLLLYYSNYQNQHVKHNDNVNSDEIELVINQTNTIMIFLIKTLGS